MGRRDLSMEWKSSKPWQCGTALQRPSVRTEGVGPWTYDTRGQGWGCVKPVSRTFKDNLGYTSWTFPSFLKKNPNKTKCPPHKENASKFRFWPDQIAADTCPLLPLACALTYGLGDFSVALASCPCLTTIMQSEENSPVNLLCLLPSHHPLLCQHHCHILMLVLVLQLEDYCLRGPVEVTAMWKLELSPKSLWECV